MGTQPCCKIKALLLIAILGVAEAHQVQQAVRLGALPHSQSKLGDVKSDVKSSSALARFLLAHNPTTAFVSQPLTGSGALRHGLRSQAPSMRKSAKDGAHAAAASEERPANPFSSAVLPMAMALAPLQALASEVVAGMSAEDVVTIDPSSPQKWTGSGAGFWTCLICLFISFPGLYSFVKRQCKSKIIRKTFEMSGPVLGGKPPKYFAAEMLAYHQANNYRVAEAFDATLIFEGKVATEFGKAAFIGTCVAISFFGLAAVLNLLELQTFDRNYVGNFWYLSGLAGPWATRYYLDNGERTDQVKATLFWDDMENAELVGKQGENTTVFYCTMTGDDEELNRFQKTLDLREKDMVYTKPLFGKGIGDAA